MRKKFDIEIDCANCAAKLEAAVQKLEGVNEASINFMSQKLILDADDQAFDDVLKNAVKLMKKVEPDFSIKL